MDNISTGERSHVMSLVKSKDTKPELFIRKFIHSKGFRFRIHDKRLPGKPDIVLKKYRTVVFVHGCFWHGHKSTKCKLARIPKSNVEFWSTKIANNAIRDSRNKRALRKLGWKVLQIWECQVKSPAMLNKLINDITHPDLI